MPASFRLSERWLAFALWLAVLGVLVITSGYAVSTPNRSGWVSYFPNPQPSAVWSAQIAIVIETFLAVVLAFILANAWFKFVGFTLYLLIALSKQDQDEQPIFGQMLKLSRPDKTMPGSYLTDVLHPLAYGWAVIIIAPVLPSLVALMY